MITAIQSSKLKTAMKLLEARERVQDSTTQICLGPEERIALSAVLIHLDDVIAKIAPTNVRPEEGPSTI